MTFPFNLFHLYRALLQFHRRTHFTDKKMNDREKTLQNKSCVATKSTLALLGKVTYILYRDSYTSTHTLSTQFLKNGSSVKMIFELHFLWTTLFLGDSTYYISNRICKSAARNFLLLAMKNTWFGRIRHQITSQSSIPAYTRNKYLRSPAACTALLHTDLVS